MTPEVLNRFGTKRVRYAPLTRYSRICPGCQARYGEGHASGMIDVQRCQKCSVTLATLHGRTEAINNRGRGSRKVAKPHLCQSDTGEE